MVVKSWNTRTLTKEEIAILEEKVRKMTAAALRRFREEFDRNAMGFAGRKEGI